MKRIVWVDTAKYICIMAVMLEHLESTTDELKCFFSPFFVLAFFAAAGYTHRSGQAFKSFFVKKIRTLFVPWLIFSVFDIALSQLVSFSAHDSFFKELGRNFLQVRGWGDQIWFVAALFMAFLPFYFFIEQYESRVHSDRRAALFLLFSLLLFIVDIVYSNLMNPNLLPWGTTALPWHIEYIFQAMFYMTLGYFFRERWESSFDHLNTPLFRFGLFALYALIIYLPYFIAVPESLFSIFAVFITPIIGIFLLFSVSKSLPETRYTMYVGKNTLIYFALHGKVFGFVEGILSRFAPTFYAGVMENMLTSNIFALVFTFLLSLALLIPAYIINRWFPFVVGRRSRQHTAAA